MRPTCEGLLITGPSCRRLDTDEVERAATRSRCERGDPGEDEASL